MMEVLMFRFTKTIHFCMKFIDDIENEMVFKKYVEMKVKEQRYGKQFIPKCQYTKQPRQFRHSTMKV